MRVRKNNKSRLQQSVARTVRVTGHCCMLLPVFLYKLMKSLTWCLICHLIVMELAGASMHTRLIMIGDSSV